jgi:hypothetical protein
MSMEKIPDDIVELAQRMATAIAGLVQNNADARLVEIDAANRHHDCASSRAGAVRSLP